MKKAYGWSLLELLVVLGLISLLILSGSSTLATVFNRTHSVQAKDMILKSLKLARQEAINRNSRVTLCGLRNNECSKSSNSQIVIFIDNNQNRKIDKQDELIRSFSLENSENQLIFKASLGRPYFRFKANGASMETGSILFCPSSKPESFGQVITLNHSGRAYLLMDPKLKQKKLHCPYT